MSELELMALLLVFIMSIPLVLIMFLADNERIQHEKGNEALGKMIVQVFEERGIWPYTKEGEE